MLDALLILRLISRSRIQSCAIVLPKYSKCSTTAMGSDASLSWTGLGVFVGELDRQIARILAFLVLMHIPMPEQVMCSVERTSSKVSIESAMSAMSSAYSKSLIETWFFIFLLLPTRGSLMLYKTLNRHQDDGLGWQQLWHQRRGWKALVLRHHPDAHHPDAHQC